MWGIITSLTLHAGPCVRWPSLLYPWLRISFSSRCRHGKIVYEVRGMLMLNKERREIIWLHHVCRDYRSRTLQLRGHAPPWYGILFHAQAKNICLHFKQIIILRRNLALPGLATPVIISEFSAPITFLRCATSGGPFAMKNSRSDTYHQSQTWDW